MGLIIANRDGELRHIAAVGNGRFWDELQITARSGPILDALQTDKALICDPFDLRKYPDLQQMRTCLPNKTIGDRRHTQCVDLRRSARDGRIPGSLISDAELEVIGDMTTVHAHALGLLLEYCGEAEAQAEQMVRMVQTRKLDRTGEEQSIAAALIGPR